VWLKAEPGQASAYTCRVGCCPGEYWNTSAHVARPVHLLLSPQVLTTVRKFRDDLTAFPPDHLVCVPLVLDTLHSRVGGWVLGRSTGNTDIPLLCAGNGSHLCGERCRFQKPKGVLAASSAQEALSQAKHHPVFHDTPIMPFPLQVMQRLRSAPPLRRKIAELCVSLSTAYVRAARTADGRDLRYAVTPASWSTMLGAALVRWLKTIEVYVGCSCCATTVLAPLTTVRPQAPLSDQLLLRNYCCLCCSTCSWPPSCSPSTCWLHAWCTPRWGLSRRAHGSSIHSQTVASPVVLNEGCRQV
jgi:hypothetical protein